MTPSLMPSRVHVLILVVAGLLFAERRADAYIDPGAANLFLQSLVGAVAALALGFRTFWRRLAEGVVRRLRDATTHARRKR